jgi:hypothetical protein
METLQREMVGQWEEAGVRSEAGIDEFVRGIRAEVEDIESSD